MKGKIHIGTSGWHYRHWIGTFYPAETKLKDQMAEYLKHFSTVELNNPFYRIPEEKTFETWRKTTPEDFIFSVKANRFITHNKKLTDPEISTPLFFERVKGLKEKLGPILFQLPPGWEINLERLDEFLAALPPKFRYVFEFRNHSWYTEEVYALLRNYHAAFCIYELNRHMSPVVVTAGFVYIRLHGPGAKYQGSYSMETLKQWATQCREWASEHKDVYVYFDNDQKGYAGFNALTLKELCSGKRPRI